MKILVLKEEGIGNAIMVIPMLRALRYHLPLSEINVMGSNRNVELLRMVDCIDNVYSLDDDIPVHDICIDTVFSCHCLFERVKDRCKICVVAEGDYKTESEARINLRCLNQIGIVPRGEFYAELDRGGYRENIICIHTGCFPGKGWNTRKWPIENWIDLINRIPCDYDVYVLGGRPENKNGYVIQSGVSRAVANLTSLTKIEETADILRRAKCCVSIDSGIAHLSCAVGTPTIILYGPTSEIKSMPIVSEGRVQIIRVPMECQRCYILDKPRWKTCKTGACMKAITPDKVHEALCKKLSQ